MDELTADKQKAGIAAQGLQQSSEEKGLLENELEETKEKPLASQVKLDGLNEQHEELSEKSSSVLTKSTGEKSKLVDENSTLQNKINVLEANIDSPNGEIQEYKDKVHHLKAQDQEPSTAQLQ